MSKIRGKNTKPELLVRQYLYTKGYRYRLHAKLPGKPDLVFRRRHIAVFVNGCFWHRHGCSISYTPKSNLEFWQKKFHENTVRDGENVQKLQEAGWKVVSLWECEIRKDVPRSIAELESLLSDNLPHLS